MTKVAMMLASVAILATAAGCGGGAGAAAEQKTGKFQAGDNAMLHNDDGEFVYIGEGQWGMPVGTEVAIVEDASDEKDPGRKVRIKAPASAVANGKGKPPAEGIETLVDRKFLRPVVK